MMLAAILRSCQALRIGITPLEYSAPSESDADESVHDEHDRDTEPEVGGIDIIPGQCLHDGDAGRDKEQ